MVIFLPVFIIVVFLLPFFFMGRGGWQPPHRMHHRRGKAWRKIQTTLEEQQREIDTLKREIEDLKKKD